MMDRGRDKSLSPDITRLSGLLLRNPASRLFVPLAEAYLKSGMRDEALLVLNEGIQHHPTFIAALVMLGKIYFKMGGREKAKDLFEQAIEVNSENIPSLKNLGAIYQEEGELQRAIETYRTILMIDPGDRAAKRLLVALEAETSMKPELEPTRLNPDDAEHEVESAPEEPGKTEEALETLTLASIYMTQGCFKEAADIYNKLLARDPADSESRSGLEEALFRLSEDSKQTPAASPSSRREKEIARLEQWLQTIQTKSKR